MIKTNAIAPPNAPPVMASFMESVDFSGSGDGGGGGGIDEGGESEEKRAFIGTGKMDVETERTGDTVVVSGEVVFNVWD